MGEPKGLRVSPLDCCAQPSIAVVSTLSLPTARVRAGGQDPRSPVLLSSAEDITSSGKWGPWTSQSPQEKPFRKEPVDFSVWAEGSTPPGFLRGLPSPPAPARHSVLQRPPAQTGCGRRSVSPPLGSHQARQPDSQTCEICYIFVLENVLLHTRKMLFIRKRFIVALSELLNSDF